MNSGHETGPEDPPEAPTPADEPAQEDDGWAALRKEVGYSSPVPPEPDTGSSSPSQPGPSQPYERHVPRPPAVKGDGEAGGDPVWTSKRSPEAQRAYQPREPGGEARPPRRPGAPYEPGTYRSPGAHQEATAYGSPPPAPYERASYPPPGPHEGPRAYQAPPVDEPGSYDVPKPRPYVSPAGYQEPIDYRPDDADSGASRDERGPKPEHGHESPDQYPEFWEPEGRGGGAHASPQRPARPARPAPPPPAMPGDTSVYRSATGRRQLVFLGAAVAVIVAAGITAAVLLIGHHGKPHPSAAGHSTPAGHSPSRAPSGSASPAASPPLTGAAGRLSVPHAIGPLRLNPTLTDKWVGPSVRHKDANSFVIRNSDVVSGFYTTDPTAATFTAKEPRIMFLAAYLAGAGNAKTALHDFMTNHTFTGQHQVSAGPRGGVAACGLLPQQPSPVAHCMWADANSYADFYAWNSSQSALAKTMISVRPQIERSKH